MNTICPRAIPALLLAIASSALGWSAPADITGLAGQREFGPRIAADLSNRLHVVWCGGVDPGSNWRVWYQHHDGSAWSVPVPIPNTSAGCSNADIAVDAAGNLHVVYDAAERIYYIARLAGTWGTPVALQQSGNKALAPHLAADPSASTILVAWHEAGQTGGTYDIRAAVRTGGVWGAPENISADAGLSREARVAVDAAGAFHVVWEDTDEEHAYYRRRDPGGTWGAKTAIDTTSARSRGPCIAAAAGGTLHCVWLDDTSGDWEILYSSAAGGSGWTAPLNISSHPGITDSAPTLALDSFGQVYVVWDDYGSIYHTARVGGSWSARTTLSAGSNQQDAHIILDGQNTAHVVWQNRNTPSGTWDIMYMWNANPPPGPRGTLAGTVRNQFGAPVAEAAISVDGQALSLSGPDGRYSGLLPPGVYTAAASKTWYAGQSVEGVVIAADMVTQQDFVITGEGPALPATAFTAAPGNRMIQLTWNHSSSANSSGTRLVMRTDRAPGGPSDGAVVVDQPGAPGQYAVYQHTGLTNGLMVYYAAFPFFQDAAGVYFRAAADTLAQGTPAGPADLDRDGDVDQADFGLLQSCLTGPFIPQTDPDCGGALLDADDDVDTDDVSVFQRCCSGPEIPSSPNCAN